jgi:uridine kinase
METLNSELACAVQTIIAAIPKPIPPAKPFLIALDGGSGAGKSSLAVLLAHALEATLIPSDDFYAAYIPDAEWDARNPQDRAADAIDWRRLRSEALEPLLRGKPAQWHPFDFEAARPDGTYAMHPAFVERQPASVIILDGAYSTRPELADLIDLAVLIDVPVSVRHERLAARESSQFLAAWHKRWDAAEAYYFTVIRPHLHLIWL